MVNLGTLVVAFGLVDLTAVEPNVDIIVLFGESLDNYIGSGLGPLWVVILREMLLSNDCTSKSNIGLGRGAFLISVISRVEISTEVCQLIRPTLPTVPAISLACAYCGTFDEYGG